MKQSKIFLLTILSLLSACSNQDDILSPQTGLEIKNIVATIEGEEADTRAEEKQTVSVGRTKFADGDKIMFTTIKRTSSPLEPFTYSGIQYQYDGKSWERTEGNTPEKIYWTDGASAHTFIGYSLPSQDYHWTNNGNGTYAGELGYNQDNLDFSTGNDVMEKEDLLLNYNTATVAETGGLSTKVRFSHALSNVRVIVNIKNFAASSSAVDTQVGVSDMILLDQPAKYQWGGDSKNLKVLDLENSSQQKKNIKLWCPQPTGEGTAQSKTFTFYGLTTPQDATFHSINGNNQPLQFSFTVTYPDPMNPSATLTKTYKGSFAQAVNFNSGMCTTLNISLNHKDEQMFVGAEYSDWNFVSTPDLGELRKKTTFMDINSAVTTHDMATATIYDATWLYNEGNQIKDVYGNDGSKEHPYRISSASQMLSFAKEVKSGFSFQGRYIRLDADITMQSSTAKTKVEDETSKIEAVSWIGIGDDSHAFEGIFLGGDRYVNRLHGNPLFLNLGTHAYVEQLYVTTIGSISGRGALAETSNGCIGGCKVIDDVTTAGGALVGTNGGIIYACYHIGSTKGTAGLADNNTGSIIGCYQAGEVEGGTAFSIAATNSGTINCPTPASLHEIQQSDFVKSLNDALDNWHKEHTGYTSFHFIFSAANFPMVQKD